jgi:hypothetical protein
LILAGRDQQSFLRSEKQNERAPLLPRQYFSQLLRLKKRLMFIETEPTRPTQGRVSISPSSVRQLGSTHAWPDECDSILVFIIVLSSPVLDVPIRINQACDVIFPYYVDILSVSFDYSINTCT